ncbi:hypothetical protein [Roseicella frigidaeris]|uniref:Uncharacterized protein n=1 Tax=Roseicella frigidaeris TaxID=2230885 RepID=A0A327LXQ8_9PROT|nr:hypothetical protein [Roseicella frigidaeris]RAI54715.1 hypothetical protein DOO78_25350 [Roseicella frigidaeris]
MAFTVDEALGDDLIHVIDRHDEAGTFTFRLGELKTPITVEIGRFQSSEHTKFWVSHAIRTPSQADAYTPSIFYKSNWGDALQEAISSLTMYYC